MAETALATAHDPAAPQDERTAALSEAQQTFMPSSVADMMPVVEFIQRQQAEAEFMKSLSRQNLVDQPSRAAVNREKGMQSVWLNDSYGNAMGEWREPWSSITFPMLRSMVDQTPVLSGVVMTRIRQVQRFVRPNAGGIGPGFRIALKDASAKLGDEEQRTVNLLQTFFTNNGWETNPRQRARLKRDNFSTFLAKSVRDSLTMDSAPIETEYKRDKKLGMDGFYAVDGGTIRLATELGLHDDDEVFAIQLIDHQIRAAYTYDDLIYVPRNPRTDVMVGGYGLAEPELLIRTVTGFLNAMTYNQNYFDKNSIPKGVLHMAGNYDQNDLAAFKRYWNAMVRGVTNAWAMPVLVAKDGESKATFEKFDVDQNEIMFAKWMTFLASIICAIYGIAPDEINFESFTSGTSSLSGSDTEEKLINSKDKGLRPLLSYYEDLFSDYVVSDFGDKYCFRWTGLDDEDEKTRFEKQKTSLTFNEFRKSQGLDEVEGKWGDAPLYQPLVGLYMQEQQAESLDYGTPGAAAGPGFGKPGGGEEDGGQPGAPGGGGKPPFGGGDDDSGGPDMAKSFGLPVFRVEP